VSNLERLEPRRLCAAAPVEAGSGPPPQVADVYVSGSAWSQDFKNVLEAQRTGSAAFGRRLTPGLASIQPWVNLNRFTLRLSYDMVVKAEDLRVRGVTSPTYAVASVETTFDPRLYVTTATFTLAGDGLSRPENLRVELEGDAGGVHSREGFMLDGDRDGTPGGDFVFRFGILPGDATRGSYVNTTDLSIVRRKLGTSVTRTRTVAPYYTTSDDFNADGRINATDLMIVRSRLGTYSPSTEPAATASAPISTPVRTRPGARELFGSTPILA